MKYDDSLKTIATGAGLVLAGMFVSKLFGYVYRIIIARIGVEQYGLLSIGLAIVGLLTILSRLGLDIGVMRYVSLYRSKKDEEGIKNTIASSAYFILVLSLIVASLLFLLSDYISVNYFNNIELSLILKILAFTIPLNSLREIIFSIIKSFEKIKYEIYSKNIIENLAKVIFTLILLVFGLGIIGASMAYLFAILLSFIFAYYYLYKKVFVISIKSKFKPIYKKLLNYSWPLFLIGFMAMIMSWIDTLMIGMFKTAKEVGYYNAALPTAYLIFIIPSAFVVLLFPILTDLYVNKRLEELESIYKIVTKWIIIFNFILLGFLLLFSKEILSILFSSEYVIAYSALIALSIGFFITYSFHPTNRLLLIMGKSKLILFNSLIILPINIFLNYFLIRQYGIFGAAIATSIALVIGALVQVVEIYMLKRLHPFKKNNIGIVTSFIISFIIVKYIYNLFPGSIFYLGLSSIIFIMIYVLLLILTKSLEREDANLLRSLKEHSLLKKKEKIN